MNCLVKSCCNNDLQSCLMKLTSNKTGFLFLFQILMEKMIWVEIRYSVGVVDLQSFAEGSVIQIVHIGMDGRNRSARTLIPSSMPNQGFL